MSSQTFIGSEFKLESVSQIALATLRLTFTQYPKMVSAGGANDSLNPANYTLTGPSVNAISNIGSVYGNAQQVDLFLNAPLTVGVWKIAVHSNVQMIDGTSILSPMVMTFNVTLLATLEPVSQGATNDNDAEVLRKFLNPALVGPGWDAIIAAIATGDCTNRVNAQLAFDQLFTSTASGIYLGRHGGDVGVIKPADVGMSDELYRQYIIKTSTGKVTYESLLSILEIFYGTNSVRASESTLANEPFFLQDGDDLTILVDENESITTFFTADDFAIIGEARAAEVAAALTRSFEINGSSAYAIPLTDPQTGLIKVQVFSGSTGLGSSVRVTGGKAQNGLSFPTQLNLTTTTFPVWNVTKIPGTTQYRFTSYQNVGDTDLNLSLLFIGDYVNVFGNEFNELNRGSFPVIDVYYAYTDSGATITQYFTIDNRLGVAEGPITQLTVNSVTWFRPLRTSIYNLNQSSAILVQDGVGYTVSLPATSSAVNRTEFTGAYLQSNSIVPITAMLRQIGGNTLVTAPNHGLLTDGSVQQVIIDGASFSDTAPTVTAGTGTGHSGNSAHSAATIVSPLLPTVNNGAEAEVLLTLASGQGVLVGGYNNNAGTITTRNHIELFTVNSITVNLDSSETVAYTWADSGVNVTQAAAFMGGSLGNFEIPALEDNVIVTGGTNCSSVAYNSAFLYNPNGGSSSLATMTTARAAHRQSTLNNGKILVTGGMTTWNQPTNAAELFDGSAWSNTGSLNQARAQHGQVVLNDGTVLVTGGRNLALGHTLDANTYALWRFDSSVGTVPDLGSNSLTLTDSSTTLVTGESGSARHFPSGANVGRTSADAGLATLFQGVFTIEGWFNNGSNTATGAFLTYGSSGGGSANNVLISIGIANDGNYYWGWQHGSNVNVYQETTALASVTATYPWNHYALTKTVNSISGYDVSLYINGLLIQTWTQQTNCDGGSTSKLFFGVDPTGSLGNNFTNGGVDDTRLETVPLSAQQIWLDYQLATGELLPFDAKRYGTPLNSCELYSSGTWGLVGQMAMARFSHRSILLPTGQVVVLGGYGYPQTQSGIGSVPVPLSLVEIYDPASKRWRSIGNSLSPHGDVWAEYLADKNQIVFGSSDAGNVEILDLATYKFSLGATFTPAKGAKSTLLPSDLVLIAGGNLSGSSVTANELYIPNASTYAAGGMNGYFAVATVVDANNFTVNNPGYPIYSSLSSEAMATITLCAAPTGTIPGPYTYDPNEGVAITGTTSTLVGTLSAGRQYGSVTMADASQFPNSAGYLVFDFGGPNQTGPVKYFGILSETSLVLDDSYVFPNTIANGLSVTLLDGKGPFVPVNPEQYGSFYVTDSPAGRIGAQNALAANTAAGVNTTVNVIFPSGRGLGGEGYPTMGQKISDVVIVWGSSDMDNDIAVAEGKITSESESD